MFECMSERAQTITSNGLSSITITEFERLDKLLRAGDFKVRGKLFFGSDADWTKLTTRLGSVCKKGQSDFAQPSGRLCQ